MLLVATLPVIGGWKLAGPFGGSARAIAIDPQNGRTLVAGSRDSLLFRSDDAGASWRLLPFPRGTPGVFNSVLIDPKESSHYYAGLDAGDSPDSGVYESKDGGEHLAGAGQDFADRASNRWPCRRSIPARSPPVHPRRVSVSDGSRRHLAQNLFGNRCGDAGYHRAGFRSRPIPSVLYAGTPHLPWKTTDGGATWHSISTGLIDDSDIFSIRVDPNRPQLVFASACSGIYRSDSGGAAWVKIQGIPGTHRRTHIIAEDPRNSDTIFAGTTLGLFKSPDGGKTWRHLSSEQVNWMVFDPGDPRTLYLATEFAGILKSTDSGETFRPMNAGLRQSSAIAKSLRTASGCTPAALMRGLFGGVFVSSDGGLQWSLRANEEALHGRNLHSLTASPANADVVFAASEDAILKSADGGKTWVPVAAAAPWLVPPGTGQRFASAGRVHIHAIRAVSRFRQRRTGAIRRNGRGLIPKFQFRDHLGASEGRRNHGSIGSGDLCAPQRRFPSGGPNRSGLFISEDAGRTWQPAMVPDGLLPLRCGAAGRARSGNSCCNFARRFAV